MYLRYLPPWVDNRAYHLATSMTKAQNVCCRRTEKTGLELGPIERGAFVRTLMRLIERGQYSKNGSLATTVGDCACMLAFVEPSVMLPHIVTGFDTALDSVSFANSMCLQPLSSFMTCQTLFKQPFSIEYFEILVSIFLQRVQTDVPDHSYPSTRDCNWYLGPCSSTYSPGLNQRKSKRNFEQRNEGFTLDVQNLVGGRHVQYVAGTGCE